MPLPNDTPTHIVRVSAVSARFTGCPGFRSTECLNDAHAQTVCSQEDGNVHIYIETRWGSLRLAPIKPAILVSSVQAVVTCYVTVPRVCTLVIFIIL